MQISYDSILFTYIYPDRVPCFILYKGNETEENIIKAIELGFKDIKKLTHPITDRIAEEMVIHGI